MLKKKDLDNLAHKIDKLIGDGSEGLPMGVDRIRDMLCDARQSAEKHIAELFRGVCAPGMTIEDRQEQDRIDHLIATLRLAEGACGHLIYILEAARTQCLKRSRILACMEEEAKKLETESSFLLKGRHVNRNSRETRHFNEDQPCRESTLPAGREAPESQGEGQSALQRG